MSKIRSEGVSRLIALTPRSRMAGLDPAIPVWKVCLSKAMGFNGEEQLSRHLAGVTKRYLGNPSVNA